MPHTGKIVGNLSKMPDSGKNDRNLSKMSVSRRLDLGKLLGGVGGRPLAGVGFRRHIVRCRVVRFGAAAGGLLVPGED